MTNAYEEGRRLIAERRAAALQMGGAEAIERQHRRGKLTCRERLDLLLDPGSFVELGILARSQVQVLGKEVKYAMAGGVVVGYGTIEGRRVYVSADDATVVSGARGGSGGAKAGRIQHLAKAHRAPMISLMEASAGRVQDQMGSEIWAGMGYQPGSTGFSHALELSGVVPLVTAIMGNAVGGASFIANFSDFVPMVKNTTFMAISGPPVVAAAVGEKIADFQELGGSRIHATMTGAIDYEAENDADCMRSIREYISYMPSSCYDLAPRRPTDDPDRQVDELMEIVPENLRKAYDMYEVIRVLVDAGRFLALKRDYGRTIITALGRINGYVVGIIANQPNHMGGVMDDQAVYKASHFMDLCDAFHIPLLFLIDTPGFIIGSQWERRGMVKGAARMLYIHRKIKVPKISVIIRKAYGLAYWVMGGKAMNPNFLYSWPIASMSLMPPDAAVDVIYQREIQSAPDPKAARERYLEIFKKQFAPWGGVEAFGLDDIIEPQDTRRVIARSLEAVMTGLDPGFKHDIYP